MASALQSDIHLALSICEAQLYLYSLLSLCTCSVSSGNVSPSIPLAFLLCPTFSALQDTQQLICNLLPAPKAGFALISKKKSLFLLEARNKYIKYMCFE